MKWRSTILLAVLALGLFLFMWFVERHAPTTDEKEGSQPLLSGLKMREVESILVQRTNGLLLQIQRTNDGWSYVLPFSYPAQVPAVEAFLSLAELLNKDFLIVEDITRTTNRFGLDQPQAQVTWIQGTQRAELRVGAYTLAGDQVYAQLVGMPGVYALPAKLLESLPGSLHDWRESSMIHWKGLAFNRLSVSNASRGFTLGFNPTNNGCILLKPFQARADMAQVSRLLVNIGSAQVSRFVNDSGRADWETFGLQPPALELSIGIDTNQILAVQFGNSPTNDSSVVYARLTAHTNLVLLPRSVLDALQLSYVDLRDGRVLSPFQRESVDSIEVRGSETFTVRRQSPAEWVVTPGGLRADPTLVNDVIGWLQQMQIIEFTRDFVTDFAPYGLTPPAYSWILRGASTNAAGQPTNTYMAQLDLGGLMDQKVFARRPDESSVYGVRLGDAIKLPDMAWKFRDRRIWSFSTNEVTQVTIEQDGRKMQIRRASDGHWSVAPGSSGAIKNELAVEETVHRLSRLRASVWSARGETNRAAYGFTEQSHRLTLDTKQDGKPVTYSVELGGKAPSLYTYAATKLEGESWFFEFPFDLYFMVMRDLSIPKPSQP